MNSKKSLARKSHVLACKLCILLSLTACQTPDSNFSRIINEPAPLPQELRASFGKVGVLPETVIPEPRLLKPQNTTEAAGTIAEATWKGIDHVLKPEEHPKSIFFELLFGPPIVLTTSIFGGIMTGVPESLQKQTEASIRQAIREEPLERGLQAKIHGMAREQQRKNLVPIGDSVIGKFTTGNPTNYQSLASAGVDSILLVRMHHHRFEAGDHINPGMSFAVEAEITVIRVIDGQVLAKNQLAYRSQRWNFVEWGTNNAKRLRSELETARSLFAEMILEQYFGE